MYLKKFEYFILDSSVAGTLLLIALAIRIEAVNAGFDQFSSNIIFTLCGEEFPNSFQSQNFLASLQPIRDLTYAFEPI